MRVDDLFPQLHELGVKLEAIYGDMCDFEFTVQDGQLYFLNARIGGRTPAAALRIATDLFIEGKITGRTMITRVAPRQIEELMRPQVVMNSTIRKLGTGMPASFGAATGIAVFSASSALRAAESRIPAILLRPEVTPEDVHAVEASEGVVTLLGGMTGHAALCCRGMKKPCVSGTGWSFDQKQTIIRTEGNEIREGDHLTIDGGTGAVYAGFANIVAPNVYHNDRLLLLLKLIEALSSQHELPVDYVGRAWSIRDIMLQGKIRQGKPDPVGRLKQWPSRVVHKGRAFRSLRKEQIAQLSGELISFTIGASDGDALEIWSGLRNYLLRLLSKNVGVGRHPYFWRPLFDPCQCLMDDADSREWNCYDHCRAQLVGEEFFSINHYVPELIDIASIRIYWAAQCPDPSYLWRVERTNPRGEKLLQGSSDLKAVKYVVNDATVPFSELASFYNSLRRREHNWNWYGSNDISRREIIDSLVNPQSMSHRRARRLAHEAGLTSVRGDLTIVGRSLLTPSQSSERAHIPTRIGW